MKRSALLLIAGCSAAPAPAPPPAPRQPAITAEPAPRPLPAAVAVAAPPKPKLVDVGAGRPDVLGDVVALADQRKWAEAKLRIAEILADEDGLAIDVRLHARAELARIHLATGKVTDADELLKSAIALWAASKSEGLAADTMGRAIYAVGEAHYHFAEKERAAVEAIKLTPMRGPRTKKTVEQYTWKVMKGWLEKKREALRKADRAYIEVAKVKPVAPPGWVVAAGRRVGDMHATFAMEFRSAPYPSEWDSKTRSVYLRELESAAAPLVRRAIHAYQKCLGVADEHKIGGEHRERCRAQLAALDP